MPALPYQEVADCIGQVKASRRASASSKLALEFLVLTAARSAEVRKATWDEIDVEGANQMLAVASKPNSSINLAGDAVIMKPPAIKLAPFCGASTGVPPLHRRLRPRGPSFRGTSPSRGCTYRRPSY